MARLNLPEVIIGNILINCQEVNIYECLLLRITQIIIPEDTQAFVIAVSKVYVFRDFAVLVMMLFSYV